MMTRWFDPVTVPLEGVQLIEASAGTGKTYSIASLFLRLLLERGLRVEEILVVTFTEAATAELHERIRARLRVACRAFQTGDPGADPILAHLLTSSRDREADQRRLRLALTEIDQAAVSTIHGFCHRMLRQYGLMAGVPADLELGGDPGRLLAEIADDCWVRSLHDLDHRLVGLVQARISPRDFLAFCRQAAGKPGNPVVGGVADRSGPESLWLTYLKVWGQARSAWDKEGTLIEQGFAEREKALTAEFKRLLDGGLLARLDAFFAGESPATCLAPPGAEQLCQGRVADPDGKVFKATAIKKGMTFSLSFFVAWEKLLAAGEALAESCQRWFLASAAAFVRAELPRRLLAGQVQSFDDLLHGLARALAGENGDGLARLIRAKFPAALIDEFQDTDPVQYGIFRAIHGSGRASLFLIGDPKQAIYAFRGADIHAYLEAAASKTASRHSMAVNWRADPTMIEAVNRLFSGVERPFVDPAIGFAPVSPREDALDQWQRDLPGHAPLQFLTLPDDVSGGRGGRLGKTELMVRIPELVAEDIADLLARGGTIGNRAIRPGDIAVLVRSNAQADAFATSLRRRGIAAALQSRASVFASPEAEECLRLLSAILDPADETRLRAALATGMLGYTANDLDRLSGSEQEMQALAARFAKWLEVWRRDGVMRLLLLVWRETSVVERLLPEGGGERRLTNLRQLAELLREAEEGDHLAPNRLRDWLWNSIAQGDPREEAELRLESDEQAVQLVTVHRSKGLEYGLVYCPYLCVGLGEPRRDGPLAQSLHDPEAGNGEQLAILPDGRQQRLAAEERFAEELRLLYVALTRARHGCMVLWAPMSGYDASALALLLHAGPDRIDDLAAWRESLAARSAESLLTELNDRCGHEAGWQLRPLSLAEASPLAPVVSDRTVAYEARRVSRRCDPVWRIGSFSHLTASSDQAAPEQWEREEALPGEGMEGAAGEGIPLADFPKGPEAGNFFHRVLETLPFAASRQALEDETRRCLRRHGLNEDTWGGPVATALGEMLATPLQRDTPFCLADIPDTQRLNEMPFFVPVSPGRQATLTASELAAPFRDHPEGLPDGYAEALAALRFVPLRGFLKGFVDLIFEHQGRWYLVDYKSNHLGVRRQDYDRAAMSRAMAHHHYYLQYHLYCLALRRYLAARLVDYDHGRHFGGVFYLFLKGMHPASGPEFGVFYDQPPLARLEALSRVLSGGGP
ncbi:MAG: UvrD-helicase domain-containing protein [Thermodesulfobacteriota bacterium]